jgi:hypothetical protein
VDCWLYVYAINNAGTIELGVIMGNQLDEGVTQTSTSETTGGTESVLYSTTGRSSKAVRVLARLQMQEATAGTWATNAITISLAPFTKFKWTVDATISGCNPTINTTAHSEADMANGSCSMTPTAGRNRLPPWITCDSTNSPSGTTCAAGNEDIGISFILPEPGTVMACWSGGTITTDAAGTGNYIDQTFELVETPTNAQTVNQRTYAKVFSDFRNPQGANSFLYIYAMSTCGILTFSSAGRKALRIFQTVNNSSGANSNQWYNDSGATHFTIYPID